MLKQLEIGSPLFFLEFTTEFYVPFFKSDILMEMYYVLPLPQFLSRENV